MKFPVNIDHVPGRKAVIKVEGEVVDPNRIVARVGAIIEQGLTDFRNAQEQEMLRDLYNVVVEDLGRDAFDNFFLRPYNTRLSAVLQAGLKKQLHQRSNVSFGIQLVARIKKQFQTKWPDIANQIRSLYHADKNTYLAFFAPKDLLGQGIFEPQETCLRKGGDYGSAGDFFRAYRRGKMLALATIKDEKIDPWAWGGGRCLVHFEGGHCVTLTNFYTNKMIWHKPLFIKAFCRLFNMHAEPEQRPDNPDLPVYLNGEGIKLTFPGRPKWERTHVWPCPQCGRQTTKRYMYYREYSDVHCTACEGGSGAMRCNSCGVRIAEDDATEEEGNYYCNECFGEIFSQCFKCDEFVRVHYVYNGRDYCRACYDAQVNDAQREDVA